MALVESLQQHQLSLRSIQHTFFKRRNTFGIYIQYLFLYICRRVLSAEPEKCTRAAMRSLCGPEPQLKRQRKDGGSQGRRQEEEEEAEEWRRESGTQTRGGGEG